MKKTIIGVIMRIFVLMLTGCISFPTEKGAGSMSASGEQKPNFVIIMCDDMGYGDWNRGGNPTIRTPNLNKMADEGVQMTQFYSGAPVCSPCRSALLTGRNCIRTGVIKVFFPGNTRGMSQDETTIAEALKPLGYATACIGKWHLGSKHEYRPLRQGFDYHYGLLYSNDMYSPDLWRNDKRIEHPTDQNTLTKRYTEEAIAFIEHFKDRPFFLYLPHTMLHVPLAASEEFRGTSERGLYGDVIEEIDWSNHRGWEVNENGVGDVFLFFFSCPHIIDQDNKDDYPLTESIENYRSMHLHKSAKNFEKT